MTLVLYRVSQNIAFLAMMALFLWPVWFEIHERLTGVRLPPRKMERRKLNKLTRDELVTEFANWV